MVQHGKIIITELMGKYDITTQSGYDFFEISSALQKCIRRGMEDDALHWAVELYASGYGEYVWKRLRIMSSEGRGPGPSDDFVGDLGAVLHV